MATQFAIQNNLTFLPVGLENLLNPVFVPVIIVLCEVWKLAFSSPAQITSSANNRISGKALFVCTVSATIFSDPDCRPNSSQTLQSLL